MLLIASFASPASAIVRIPTCKGQILYNIVLLLHAGSVKHFASLCSLLMLAPSETLHHYPTRNWLDCFWNIWNLTLTLQSTSSSPILTSIRSTLVCKERACVNPVPNDDTTLLKIPSNSQHYWIPPTRSPPLEIENFDLWRKKISNAPQIEKGR